MNPTGQERPSILRAARGARCIVLAAYRYVASPGELLTGLT